MGKYAKIYTFPERKKPKPPWGLWLATAVIFTSIGAGIVSWLI